MAFVAPIDATAQGARNAIESYLESVGIGARERAAAALGDAIAKRLPTKDDHDVTVFGIVGVSVRRDVSASRSVALERALGASVGNHYVFGEPPSPDDVRAAAFSQSEYGELRKCKPGDCGFKLSASSMSDFATKVEWSTHEAKSQADALLRAELLALVDDYAGRGDRALPTYDDRGGRERGGCVRRPGRAGQ
jgi:hypothetical protein